PREVREEHGATEGKPQIRSTADHAGTGLGIAGSGDFWRLSSRRCSRDSTSTNPNQPSANKAFKAVKCLVVAPRTPPSQTPAADKTSPTRQRKLSITALALYLASRETTRKSELPAVFCRE